MFCIFAIMYYVTSFTWKFCPLCSWPVFYFLISYLCFVNRINEKDTAEVSLLSAFYNKKKETLTLKKRLIDFVSFVNLHLMKLFSRHIIV